MMTTFRQFHRQWRLIVQQLWNDDAAAMSVDDVCFAFLTKIICRIEAGEYARNSERQTCATSVSVLALRQVSPSESARTSELAFRANAAWIPWTCSLVLSLNC